jgi:hypothetical protein
MYWAPNEKSPVTASPSAAVTLPRQSIVYWSRFWRYYVIWPTFSAVAYQPSWFSGKN